MDDISEHRKHIVLLKILNQHILQDILKVKLPVVHLSSIFIILSIQMSELKNPVFLAHPP